MLHKFRSVYVYGAGGFAKRLTAALKQHNIPIAAYLTQDGAISPYFGPTIAFKEAQPCKDDVVVIGVFNPDVDCRNLFIKLVEDCGFENVLFPWDCIQYLGSDPENYWMNDFGHSLNSFTAKIAKVESLLTDDESIQLFRSIINFRNHGQSQFLPVPSIDDQYRPGDLIKDKTINCLVDVGAYIGDTLQDFTSSGFKISQAITFEPDGKNRGVLLRTVAKLGIPSVNLPFGLGRRAAQYQLSENGSGSTLIDSHRRVASQAIIQSVALDEVISGLSVDFIKIDVEGFEISALMGMKNILRSCEPRLAISLYHKPLDLLHIPLLINAIAPNKKMAIRQHRYNLFDTVLYWNYY
jgi:FkbM family methyltransferase